MDSGHSYYAPIVPLFIITAAAKSDSLWCIRRILWNADLTSLSIVIEILFTHAYTTLIVAACANKVAASVLRIGSLFATWSIHGLLLSEAVKPSLYPQEANLMDSYDKFHQLLH